MPSDNRTKLLAKVLARLIGLTPSARRWHAACALLVLAAFVGALAVNATRRHDAEVQREHATQIAAQAAKQAAATEAAARQARADADAKAAHERLLARYVANRARIVALMRSDIKRGDPAEALRAGGDYLAIADEEFKNVYSDAQTALDAAREKVERAQEKADRAQMRKEGVSLGMTAERAVLSSWGEPDSINRTITAHGTHEQWVYERYRHGFLYFDDGVLTGIQN